jgi:acetyl esterase
VTLDRQAKAILDQLPNVLIDYDVLPVSAMRQGFDAMAAAAQKAPVAEVADLALPGPAGRVPARLYRPVARRELPALVYFHGGGFVTGSVESHDSLCRTLANASGAAVLSVDYRLAPENPFPAATDDCLAAVRAAAGGAVPGIDPERLAVAGDSAGGNLAAVTALRCRDEGGPELRHQILFYPVIDRNFDTPSYLENADGYLLSRRMMMWFWDKYGPASLVDDPRACPIRAEKLAGVAPATVITAEYDPLRDEGEAYAARLREAGVPTQLRRYDGMIHGFVSFETLDRGRAALDAAGAVLREALA